jgi:hypothetical protein
VLVGDPVIEIGGDSDSAGRAEAFQYIAGATGTARNAVVYVDSANTATTVTLGLFTNSGTNTPGTLLAQASINNPQSAAWNTVPIAPTGITSGTKYWLAILSPSGGGTVRFRDKTSGNLSQHSAESGLIAMPAVWSSGQTWPSSSMSAYLTL